MLSESRLRTRRGLTSMPGRMIVGVVAGLVATAVLLQACGQASASGTSGSRLGADSSRHTTTSRASGSAVSARFFGMHAPTLDTAYPKAKVGSYDLTTNGVYWPDIETAPGTYDFTKLDLLVDRARSKHAQPLLVLGQTPAFDSTQPGAANVHATMPKMGAWKAYVSALVNRYGTKIDYGIWPEPNITENWSGTPKQLATLVSAASKIIHAKAKHAVVVSPAFVLRLKFEQKFMNAFFASKVGGKPIGRSVDAVGVDPYPLVNGTPEDSLGLIKDAGKILKKHKVKAPLWNVEINFGVVGGHAGGKHWSNTKQQQYLVRNYLLDAGASVARVYWLGWFSFSEAAVQLVQSDGVTPTPAATSLGVVQTWLTGERVSPCARAKKTKIWSCKLVAKGHTSWVYWVTRGTAYVKAPQKTRKVSTITGSTKKTHPGKRLKVTASPIWVHR
ncbi:MAG: hypothetical protein QM747_08870 [Nocardioides sp.]